MAGILSAHVVPESGNDFTARIANLTPATVFVETKMHLEFGERVTVTFFSVSVEGVVIHASVDPPGVVVVFDATPETRSQIVERMGEVRRVWPDAGRGFSVASTLETVIPPAITERHQFDEPTNTGSPPIIVADPDVDELSSPVALPLVRESPRLRATTVVGNEPERDELNFEETTEDGIPV
jgi:hypothetical protein